jgi:hypothetical protein
VRSQSADRYQIVIWYRFSTPHRTERPEIPAYLLRYRRHVPKGKCGRWFCAKRYNTAPRSELVSSVESAPVGRRITSRVREAVLHDFDPVCVDRIIDTDPGSWLRSAACLPQIQTVKEIYRLIWTGQHRSRSQITNTRSTSSTPIFWDPVVSSLAVCGKTLFEHLLSVVSC